MHTTGSTLSTAKVRARRLCFLASGSPLNRCPSKCQGAGYLKHPDAAYTFAFSRSSLLFWHYSCGSFHRSPFLNFFLVEHRKFTFLDDHHMSCHYWSHHNFPSEIRFIFAKQIRPLRLGSSVFCGACGPVSGCITGLPRWHLGRPDGRSGRIMGGFVS